MRPVPKIENELDVMMEKTRNISKDEIQGEWKFNGYFPKQCKAMPLCHMNEIKFSMDDEVRNGDMYRFDTKGTKTGNGCRTKDEREQDFGSTWVRDSYMFFSQRKNAP